MPTFPCDDAAGSINIDPVSTDQYVQNTPCIGTWEISGQDDYCAQIETKNQEAYAAEVININGAPLNIFRLLGVHEQGDGSLLASGEIFVSPSEPGFPISGINTGGAWHSLEMGTAVAGNSYVGIDFGIDLLASGQSEYAPSRPKLQKVGAVIIKQGNTAFNFARQVKIEIADGTKFRLGTPQFTGTGDGVLSLDSAGPSSVSGTIFAQAISPSDFDVSIILTNGGTHTLGIAQVGQPFRSVFGNITISQGTIPFAVSDIFSVDIDYEWFRAGVFNLVQSASSVTLNLQSQIFAKAVRVVPTLFTGTDHWEVTNFDVLEKSPTDINNIQDMFFNENRDRDYSKDPIRLKSQYSMNDSISDLSKFGLNILDQYSFTVSFPVMVAALGRPIVAGDIIEVIPEMQYDHNLKPIKKFLEVQDTGWSSAGFSTAWKPTLYRFSAQQALPSQETRDIFGTIDTQKYLVADSILGDLGIGQQIDTTPLTISEEIRKEAAKAVPETGSSDSREHDEIPLPKPVAPVNAKGQPLAKTPASQLGIYIEDGLPKNGEPYGEGYALPEVVSATDGEYFRLNYPTETNIAPRLYRLSLLKNRWIFMETDRRQNYASAKPSMRKILNSPNKIGLGKKTT